MLHDLFAARNRTRNPAAMIEMKRPSLPFVLALFVGILLAAMPSSRAAEEPLPADLGTRQAGIDWPSFLGPERNSRSPETGLATDWSGGPPRVVWQCPLGESYAAPSISRGRLFHFDRYGEVHRLVCRNSETGAELWTYGIPADYSDMLGYNNGPRCTPVVDGDRVYVQSPEGQLHCVRISSGKRVWEIDTIKQFGVVKNFFGVGSTPIVWGDFLVAGIGGSPAGSPPDVYAARGRLDGNGTGIVALDKFTGEVRWKSTDELASYASPVIAEIGGRPWGFHFARGGLVGFDPRTGALDFQFAWRSPKLESVNASSPVVVGDEVFISESYGPGSALLRVNAGKSLVGGVSDADAGSEGRARSASERPPTGKEPGYEILWQGDPRKRDHGLELHWNTAVHHDGFLYASSGQHAGAAELRCIERATGDVQWAEPGLGRCSLLYVDGSLVCLGEEGDLRLLRATPKRYEVLADLTPRAVAESLRDSDAAVSEKRPNDTAAVSEKLPNSNEPLLTYPAWAAPVLSHGLLYVRGGDRLVCLELIPSGDQ
jgi:outer membrane protein assembly factor BamB